MTSYHEVLEKAVGYYLIAYSLDLAKGYFYPHPKKALLQSNLFRAVVIILFGIVAFDMMAVTVRMLGSEYPVLQISVLRNIFGILPAMLLLIIGPGLSSLRCIINRDHLKIIMIRSIAVLVAQFSYYTALTKIEFATAVTLGFTSPFFCNSAIDPIAWPSNRLHKIYSHNNRFLGSNSYLSASQ